MDANTFGKLISELSLYFERKPPTQATFQQWVVEMQTIPNSALHTLMGAVKELESWPRNLPNFLKGKYCQVRESDPKSHYAIHPRRLHPERYAKEDCKTCQGKGTHPWPMDWPVRRDERGLVITRKFSPQALCQCTDAAEYGF